MVVIKIILTVLGIYVICSEAAPSSPTLISKLLTQPEDNDFEIPTRKNAEDGVSTHHEVTSPRRPNREIIPRAHKGLLLKEELITKNINDDTRSFQIITPGKKSIGPSPVRVSPNVHSDYLHIENYIPTYITIPCASDSSDTQSHSKSNCQILSDTILSNEPSTNSIHCPENISSHEDRSLIISAAPTLIPVLPPGTEYLLSSTREPLPTYEGNLSDTEFSEYLQSEIHNLPLIESEHLVNPEVPLLPNSHYATYDDINIDLHDFYQHEFSEFTSYPQPSVTEKDKIITSEIETNLSHIPPSSFETTVLIPEPPAYFPFNPSYTETVVPSADEGIVSHNPSEQINYVTVTENTLSSFQTQPIIVIPEAPSLMPLNPPIISYNHTLLNITADELTTTIYPANLDAPKFENTLLADEKIDTADNFGIQTNLPEKSPSPLEPVIIIPEPPIYFPLNPPYASNAMQNGDGESYTLTNPENTSSSIDNLPTVIIPEAPELIPLNPPNVVSSSSSERPTALEITQTVHSGYYDYYNPEIVTEPEEIVESTHVVIPPAPALMPLYPADKYTILISSEQPNYSSSVENNTSNTENTVDHAHIVTLDDSPNLLISHYMNSQNNIELSSFGIETTSSQYELIEIPDVPKEKPSSPSQYSNDDGSLYYQDKNTEVTYDNEEESWSVDSIKIPEAPLLMPLNPPYTSAPYIPITTSNHSLEDRVNQVENAIHNDEVLTLSINSQLSTSEAEITKDELCENPAKTIEESELKSENTPLNILLSMNQQITLPHILHNSNVRLSNNHNEIQGQKDYLIPRYPEYSSSVHKNYEPLSIYQNSNIVMSSSPITVEKTNEIVSQMGATIQNLKLLDEGKQIQRKFKELPPCMSDKPIDGVVTKAFEPKKCKQEVEELRTDLSSKQTSKHSRRRKVVVRNRKNKVTNNNN